MFNLGYTYKRPKTLFGTQNAKTIKGEKLGYTTLILYMSPEKQNTAGKNLCAHASEGCKAACLFTAGRGKFSNVMTARIHKTEYFLRERSLFLEQVYNEVAKGYKKYGKTLAVRLNGTSDIPYENLIIKDNKNIMQLFPEVQFYDYTKDFSRMLKPQAPNYHLTYSVDERPVTRINAATALSSGLNAAMVFNVKDESELPAEYMGFPVINGDEHDLTFLHGNGVIVGLKAKGAAKKDTTGFVIQL
jgi:hypothetical protein